MELTGSINKSQFIKTGGKSEDWDAIARLQDLLQTHMRGLRLLNSTDEGKRLAQQINADDATAVDRRRDADLRLHEALVCMLNANDVDTKLLAGGLEALTQFARIYSIPTPEDIDNPDNHPFAEQLVEAIQAVKNTKVYALAEKGTGWTRGVKQG